MNATTSSAPTLIQYLYLALGLYLATGALVSYTCQAHQSWFGDLVARANRVLPGFEDGFRRGATRFGYGSEARFMGVLNLVLTWPVPLLALCVLLAFIRRLEAMTKAWESERERGAILGENVVRDVARLREDVRDERIGQIDDVFSDKQSTEDLAFITEFFEKIRAAFPADVASLNATPCFSWAHSGKSRDVSLSFEFHREVLVSSLGFFPVSPLISVRILVSRFDRNGTWVSPVSHKVATGTFGWLNATFNRAVFSADGVLPVETGWDYTVAHQSFDSDEESDIGVDILNEMLCALDDDAAADGDVPLNTRAGSA